MDSKRHALTFVVVTVFLDAVGFGIITPILPQFLISLVDISLSEASAIAGYLVVSYAILQFVFAPILGNLSDRFGRRRVLLASLAMYSVNYLLAGLAGTLWLLFVGRVLTGITSATHATANALIADVSPPEERAQNFGLIGVAFGLGFIVGPSLGGLVGEYDLRLPFFLAAGLAAVNTLYGYLVLEETLPQDRRRPFQWKRANPIGMLLQIRRYPILIGLIIVMFIYNIAHHVYPSNWSFYTIEKFAWTPFDIGASLALVGILAIVVQGFLIRVVIPRWGAPTAAFVGFTAQALAYLGISFAGSSMALYLWCVVSGFAGLVAPSVSSIMANQVQQNEQGELQGINASMGSVAAIIGPLLMTQSFTYFTGSDAPIYLPGIAFIIAATLAVISLVVFAVNLRVIEPRVAKDQI